MADPIEGIQAGSDNEMRSVAERVSQAVQRTQVNSIPRTQDQRSGQSSSGDALSISPSASFLASAGVNRSLSQININNDSLDFNLRFDPGQFEQLAARGNYNRSSDKLDMTVEAQFQHQVENQPHHFAAKVRFRATNIFEQLQSGGDVNIQGEVDNLMNLLMKRSMEKQYPPRSVVLHLADIADLVSEGGTFQRVSRAMMVLNRALARALDGEAETQMGLDEHKPKAVEVDSFTFKLEEVSTPKNNKPAAPQASHAIQPE